MDEDNLAGRTLPEPKPLSTNHLSTTRFRTLVLYARASVRLLLVVLFLQPLQHFQPPDRHIRVHVVLPFPEHQELDHSTDLAQLSRPLLVSHLLFLVRRGRRGLTSSLPEGKTQTFSVSSSVSSTSCLYLPLDETSGIEIANMRHAIDAQVCDGISSRVDAFHYHLVLNFVRGSRLTWRVSCSSPSSCSFFHPRLQAWRLEDARPLPLTMWSHRTSDVQVDSSIHLFLHRDLSLHAHRCVDHLVDELDLEHLHHLLNSLDQWDLSLCHHGNIHYSVDELELRHLSSVLSGSRESVVATQRAHLRPCRCACETAFVGRHDARISACCSLADLFDSADVERGSATIVFHGRLGSADSSFHFASLFGRHKNSYNAGSSGTILSHCIAEFG